jgi:uncharacterized protein (DUF1697 family)
MKELVAMFERAGCSHVRHYIQSGNVLFDAKPALSTRVPGLVEAEVERTFGFRPPVVVRSRDEMEAVARDNPHLSAGLATESLHVMFLRDRPGAKECAALEPDRSPPDAFVVRGREIYLFCPSGMGETKLTNAYFDSKLRTTCTARNWRTVLQLVEMCGAR